MTNHNNTVTGNPGGQQPQAYPLDNYTVSPATQKNGNETPFYKSQAPAITLPKGGGALKGIDEKFNVNAVNGTASLDVPLPLSPGRDNFTPGLSLSYNSGAGNSEFGLGWRLSLASIQRKTDKKLPLYDAGESDVFLLAGSEDLVPLLDPDGSIHEFTSAGYTVRRYIPRIEGLFARIEYIKKAGTADTWWRVTTKDNITTWYGLTPEARIADPLFAHKVFRWLPQITIDQKGNVQEYSYLDENNDNVPAAVHEQNRLNGLAHYANKYLKKVSYCNTVPFFVTNANPYEPDLPSAPQYLMEAVFDYGDHTGSIPDFTPDTMWSCRKDPFSDFHAGFEIRTWRKCQRILIFHSFSELGDGLNPAPVLVRSLDLSYQQDTTTADLAEADLITKITQTGYKKKPDGNSFYRKSLPPMVLNYQPLQWDTTIHPVTAKDSRNAPQGLTGNYQWTDLYGEGLSGILSESANGWFYKTNLGDGHFSEAIAITQQPSLKGLGKTLQWQDLDADGKRQLVSTDQHHPGYFELDDDQHWQGFVPFKSIVNINWSDPYTKILDLDGDGRPDVLITDDHIWTWWANTGKKGYTRGGKCNTHWDEEKGPRLLINDTAQSIFLADMNGDGLTDFVRIKNGEVCYWPNMGYGKFGAKVNMSHAPVFADAGLFNPLYLHLADISGTGAPDLLYRSPDGITAWVNLAGNGWSDPVSLGVLPSVEANSTVAVLDFLGNGTGCLVWSSPLPQHASLPMRYIDLMGGLKPYILKSYHNSTGKQVSLTYKSSTKYYLDDKKAGNPWATRLPFPVQCLSSSVTTDSVSETSYAQSYSYHHGYYDHEEREFRGFGRVDTIDTDSAAFYAVQNNTTSENDLKQHPVLTKTWYHTGAWLREKTLLDRFETEYFRFDGWDAIRAYATFPTGLSAQETREAHRALKGSPIRQEIYAMDGTPAETIPYTVTVSAYEIQLFRQQKNNRFASFLNHLQQKVAWHCERMPIDARVVQDITLVIDTYGNILESAQISYPRKYIPGNLPDRVKEAQRKMHITYQTKACTNDIETATAYRLRVPWESTGYELQLPDSLYPAALFTKESFYSVLPAVTNALDYAASPPAGTASLRRLSCSRSLFREDNAVTVAPAGTFYSLAIPHQQYTLAFTADIIKRSFNDDVTSKRLEDGMLRDTGYVQHNNIAGFPAAAVSDEQYDWWWVPSGIADYNNPTAHFYLPHSFTDPWGNTSYTTYWSGYNLLPATTTDPAGNATEVIAYDWRCLQPIQVKDLNDNHTVISYDTLCMPVAMAVKGKNEHDITAADELIYNTGGVIDAEHPDDQLLQKSFWNDPATADKDLLGHATWRCLYDLEQQPACVAMIARGEHFRSVADKQALDSHYPDSPVLTRITYTDGLGRIAMHKTQADDDPVTHTPRWTGSGKTVYNNKGNTVLQYEPYFSTTHQYDPALQAALQGVSSRLHYDPLDRVLLKEIPDGTYSCTTWDSWTQIDFDPNDTAMDSAWYAARIHGDMGSFEQDAAQKTDAHWQTATTLYLDTLSRPCYTLSMSSNSNEIHSCVEMDIHGNRIRIIDGTGSPAIHRVSLQYQYNMLQNVVWQSSIDSGEQRILTDAGGQPCYAWDATERRSHMVYDMLRRPLRNELSLPAGSGSWYPESYLSVMIYGENVIPLTGTPQDHNLRGKLADSYDSSGRHWTDAYDFKGQPVQSFFSLLAQPYHQDTDWKVAGPGDLSTEVFITTAVTDALGRPQTVTDAGNNVTRHTYRKSGMLQSVYLTPSGGSESVYVQDIHYDAKGQRKAIWYGNHTKTKYTYDPLTFRLRKLCTVNLNTSPHTLVRDLDYYYDPSGNITCITDKALDTFFYNNSLIKPESFYTYDALYRLISAEGREMINSNGFTGDDRYDDIDAMMNATPQWNGQALQNYTQQYTYDKVGNILELVHSAATGGYTRTFKYDTSNNYLHEVTVGGQTYDYYKNGAGYDARGNMLQMPHLDGMQWDLSNRFCTMTRSGMKTWYQYSGGQRTRKYTDKGAVKEERIYLGSYELYRKYDNSNTLISERSTVHIMDDSGRIAMLEVRNPHYGSDGSEDLLLRYIYSSHLQSSALELDEKGDLISYEEYHPYGTTAYQAMTQTVKATAKRYRFTGKERDEESGFYYHGARYYAPWLCRWTAADPINSEWYNMLQGKAGRNMERNFVSMTASPYEYCYDNPVMYDDPSGEQPPVDGSLTASFKLNLTITLGQKGTQSSNYRLGAGVSLAANGSIGDAAGQVSLNASAFYSNGGLSSPFGKRRDGDSGIGEFIFSPAFSVGGNANMQPTTPVGINFLHGNATTALNNTIKYSFNYALNFHTDTDHRNQRTATYGIRIGQFSGNVLEDHKSFKGGDGFDRYWTGSGNINWQFKDNSMLTIGTDTYTGESKNDKSTPEDLHDEDVGGIVTMPGKNKGKEFFWANQEQKDREMGLPLGYNQSLNNAQTYVQFTNANGSALRLTSVGQPNFWSQNAIHNMFTPVFHHFKSSTDTAKWQLSGSSLIR